MRIHSDILTEQQIRDAVAEVPGVSVYRITPHGSRSRKRAFEVFLTGHGRNGGQYGNLDGHTASWDDWGMVLARLYMLDRELTIPRAYVDLEHFRQVTVDRFLDEELIVNGRWVLVVDDPDPVHHHHRWLYGAPGYFYCKGSRNIDCTAELRR